MHSTYLQVNLDSLFQDLPMTLIKAYRWYSEPDSMDWLLIISLYPKRGPNESN